MKKIKLSPSLLALGAVTSIGVGGLAYGATTFAVTASDASPDSSLVDALVKKFNLNKTEVQSVVDSNREAHRAEMETKRADALKQALTDKKITQDQYNHIVSAWKDIDDAMKAAGDRSSQTDAQRQAIKDKMDALRDWMKAQNLTPATIGEGMGFNRMNKE